MNNLFWRNKRFVVVEHEANEVGPGHVLEKFLLKHIVKEVLYIGHPNLYIRTGYQNSSRFVRTHHGVSPQVGHARYYKLPEPFLYIKDCVYTLLWVNGKQKFDCFIGLGNLNAFCGLLLKKVGIVKTVVYYVIDYIPQRFANPIFNNLYHYIDKIAATHSDATWNLSPRMIEGREKRWRMKFPNQTVVPHGLYFDPAKISPFNQVRHHEIVYMGTLNEEQGIQLVIEALPKIKKKIPDIAFRIIGTGNYEIELKAIVKRLNLESSVIFEGLIKNNEEMEKLLSKSAVAVAMYNPKHGFSQYSDPGKIKHYLSVGLPVIMTSKPFIASIIQRKNCGFAIDYDKNEFTRRVISLASDSAIMKEYRHNALSLAKHYDWDTIYAKEFIKIL